MPFGIVCPVDQAHVVRIGEDAGRTALLVDGVVQSISPADGLATGGYWAAMVPAVRPDRALILGLGGGTVARLLRARWGEHPRIVGVDDDVGIVETARTAGWLSNGDVEVVFADAFEYVRTCAERFDFVAIDLFRGERLIGRATTRPFLRSVRALLEPPAMLAINLYRDLHAPLRIARLERVFDIRDKVIVGGNVIVHAQARRARNNARRRSV
jgi:spermidine synthase